MPPRPSPSHPPRPLLHCPKISARPEKIASSHQHVKANKLFPAKTKQIAMGFAQLNISNNISLNTTNCIDDQFSKFSHTQFDCESTLHILEYGCAWVTSLQMNHIHHSCIRVIYVSCPCAIGFGLCNFHDIFL